MKSEGVIIGVMGRIWKGMRSYFWGRKIELGGDEWLMNIYVENGEIGGILGKMKS